MKRLYESVKKMVVRKVRLGRSLSEVKELYRALTEQWETLPRGWTKESLRQFWNTLTGGTPAGEGGVRKCIAKIKRTYPEITDPEAFCASAADQLFPGWRQKAAKERRKRKGEE
jgi:hypothetical protein